MIGHDPLNKDLVVKISKVVIILSFFIIVFSFFLFRNPKPIILGYIFGALVNILSFFLISNSAYKLVQMSPQKAKIRASSNYILRFFIYFIVLFISIKADYLNYLATFVGLTMVRNAIFILNFIDKEFLI